MEWIRIRQPPGGNTNDIFHLEERQRVQENERLLRMDQSREQDECLKANTGKSGLMAPKRPAEYAGITEYTRVRKPPGGDTHDIFDLEKRQKSDAYKLHLENLACLNRVDPQEKPQCDVQLSPTTLSDPMSHTSEQVKENIDSDVADPVAEDEDKPNEEDEAEAKPPSSKTYLRHNTITGEVSEVQVSSARPKLRDRSNLPSVPDQDRDPKEMLHHRSSVRVRQPPGGASSLIF